MFPPLFNANHHNQQQIPHINISPTTTATTAAAASQPVVPAKRKRASTSIPAQGLQQHQHQQQQFAHLNHQQQTSHPTLPPRSYSAYSHTQHPPSSAASVAQQTPGVHPSLPPSSTVHIPSTATSLQYNNINGNGDPAGGLASGSAIDDIHCICGYTDDDGYTIACDDCQRWSHMVCFNISVGKDPPEWRCWECAPREVNVDRARERQAARVAAQRRLGPLLGTPEAEALAQMEARQRKRRDRKTGTLPGGASAPPLSASHSSGADQGGEDEHIDIEDDWKLSYVQLTEDLIPQASTRAKLRIAAQNWRGITALSSDESEPADQRTKVVPVPNSRDDVAAAVRPPTYSLQTIGPIANDGLIAPLTSTIIPSAQYLSDPLNGYAQMGLPKPHVHLVPPPLSVALDARMAGNEARFIRTGCRPNAVLRPVLCPSKQSNDDNEQPGVVKFALFALRDLKASEEVVLSWEWDDGAVVHQLPALIEEGMRSGAGPSKMTPHHIERLRLQMQSIVESLKSSFVTCACGSAASDCAVRLMEMFADGGIHWLNAFSELRNRSPKVSRTQNDAQAGLSRPSSSQARPNQSSNSPHFCSPSQPSRTSPSANRHGAPLNDVQDHGRYMNAKMRAKMLGPLVGAERGVRTRLVGGPHSGGLMGVRQVSGDRWDQFGELDAGEGGREGSSVPEVRIEKPSPARMKEKGKGVVRGPNGVGFGIGLEARSPGANQASPLRSSLAPGVGSPTINSEDEIPREIREEKMPPRMRKKWMQKRLQLLRSEYPPETETSENGIGLGLCLNRSSSTLPNGMDVDSVDRSSSETDSRKTISNGTFSSTPTDTTALPSTTPREETNAMDIDLDALQMPPPPPPPTAASVSSGTSPRPSLQSISTSTSVTSSTSASTQHVAPSQPRSLGRSSLFSLLNDQPVSPIHSSRYLAQIMNPAPPTSASASSTSSSTTQNASPVSASNARESELEPVQATEFAPSPSPPPQSEPVEEQGDEIVIQELEVKKERLDHVDFGERPQTFGRDSVDESRSPEPVMGMAEPRVESDSPGIPTGTGYREAPSIPESVAPTPAAEPIVEEESVRPATGRPPPSSPSTLSSAADEEEEESEGITALPRAEEVKEVTPSPTSPSELSASREPTPKPAVAPAYMPSPSPAALPLAEETAVSSPLSPSPPARSVSVQEIEIDKARSTSPASSAPGMATHGVHEFMSAAPPTEMESPAMLFKEELMEAELARTGAVAESPVEKVETARVESEDESEVKMMVDHAPNKDRQRSVLSPSPISSLSASERRSVSVHDVTPEQEEKERDSMEVDEVVEVKADSDEEMHDVNEALASPQQTRVSLSPAPAVEVQQPSPPPQPSVKSSEHSPLVEIKSVTPETDSYEEKQAILATVSVVPEQISEPERAPVANHAITSNDAQLLASPSVLRALSPTVSIGSSAAVRPTPPPFAFPSDTEHEHEADTDRIGRSRASSQVQDKAQSVIAPATPSEPQKIRRSMADYKQRRKKQREEEAAAKAAMMSPTSPTSPLHQDIGVSSATGETSEEKRPDDHNMEVEQTVGQNGSVEPGDSHHHDEPEPMKVEPRPISLLDRIDKGDRVSREVPVGAGSLLHMVANSYNVEASPQVAPRPELSPRHEAREGFTNLSPSPVVENKVLPSWKFDSEPRSTKVVSPPLSPTSVRSKVGPGSPQPEEDGEILNAPPRTTTPPSAPRADAARAKANSESPSAPTTASSTFSNSRVGRGSTGAIPPTQPRSFRDDRRIPSTSPPPRYRDSLPPPSAASKPKAPWASRDRTTSGPEKDKKMDSTSPVSARRASSYVPTPPPKPGPGSASGASSGPSASVSTTGLRGQPPSGPRALRGPPAGPARTQGPPVSRIPLSERVERDRSRDRDREREKDRDRIDRERERDIRDRDYDRYSPPRARFAGRGRGWRGRR